jgi:hypothetical protein
MNIADARRAAVSGLRFKKWPIIMKIMAISAISIAFISGLNLFYFVPLIESRVVDARQNEIRNLVSMAHDIFDEYEADVRKSQVTRGMRRRAPRRASSSFALGKTTISGSTTATTGW